MLLAKASSANDSTNLSQLFDFILELCGFCGLNLMKSQEFLMEFKEQSVEFCQILLETIFDGALAS